MYHIKIYWGHEAKIHENEAENEVKTYEAEATKFALEAVYVCTFVKNDLKCTDACNNVKIQKVCVTPWIPISGKRTRLFVPFFIIVLIIFMPMLRLWYALYPVVQWNSI